MTDASLPSDLISVPCLAAEIEGFDERMIRRWISAGVLPHYRIGRRVFLSRSEVARAASRSSAER